jgi:hypothetical protein
MAVLPKNTTKSSIVQGKIYTEEEKKVQLVNCKTAKTLTVYKPVVSTNKLGRMKMDLIWLNRRITMCDASQYILFY